MARELILKLGKKITDRVDVKLGMTQLDETSPEYYGLASVVTDEMAELALAMKVRVPTTPAEIGKKVGKDPVYVEQLFDQMSMIGLLEYNWENADHHKQWTLPIFVPGSAELMNMNLQQVEEHPEIAQFFERMAFLPLTKITCMVPPGGAGVGMHVIPVEKAIPATNESVDVEHISHWLKKYEDHLGVGYCSCRNAMRLQGQGCGELQDEMCIAVGQFCDYCLETGKGRKITYEEAMEILQRAEDNGYVHQITNIDGEDKIFAICNCALGSCFALRTSQLFNTPNLSASAYVAESDPEKCVACGKCASRPARPALSASARSSAPRKAPSSIRTTSCRTTPSGARITGTRIIAMRTAASRRGRPARRPARPPARRTSPSRATSRWQATAGMPTRSSSSRRITRSRPSAAASAESTVRMPAPAAPSTSRWPSTRSRSSSPSRT